MKEVYSVARHPNTVGGSLTIRSTDCRARGQRTMVQVLGTVRYRLDWVRLDGRWHPSGLDN